jgi:enoyl-CoA hydratase/carnithine racemase
MRVEVVEERPVVFSFAQYCNPRQTGLRSLKQEKFKQGLVVAHRHTPFRIMVVNVKRVVATPGAALHHCVSLHLRPSMSLGGMSVHKFGEQMFVSVGMCDTCRIIFPGKYIMTDTILYRRDGHVGNITLNNPLRHNALGREQLEAIRTHLDQIAANPQVRALVITGLGEKTFCAGASLQELSDGHLHDDAFQKMTGQLADLAIPTICALNGNVFGGGVELAASCDFRIGVDGSRMRVPAAELGLCYPLAGINRLVECLGVSKTKRILIAAEEFDANEMVKIGFLDTLVVSQELAEVAQRFAQRLAGLAPLAVQAMKRILRQVAAGAVEPDLARDLSTICLQSSDLREGFTAKREKRSPQFEGR